MSTVTEMIAYLQQLPGDLEVIMSKDGEGNAYSPWCGEHSIGHYTPENTYAGEFTSHDNDEGTIPHPDPNALVLWPTN